MAAPNHIVDTERFLDLRPHGLTVQYVEQADVDRLAAKTAAAYRWMVESASSRALRNRGIMIVGVYSRWRQQLVEADGPGAENRASYIRVKPMQQLAAGIYAS